MKYNQIDMKWFEAINLELSLPENKTILFDLIKRAKSSSMIKQDPSMKVSVFRNVKTGNHWSILLQRENSEMRPGKTPIGKSFADVASSLGQVKHDVWRRLTTNHAA